MMLICYTITEDSCNIHRLMHANRLFELAFAQYYVLFEKAPGGSWHFNFTRSNKLPTSSDFFCNLTYRNLGARIF
jgi:hypothetical protein